MTPVEAFRCIALNCLEHFQRNEQGLLTSDDPEFVHQARIALRRQRSAIKLFAPVLPAEFVSAYSKSWKTLGEARNWDVFLSETLPPTAATFPTDKEIKRLRKAAQHKTQSMRKSIIQLLATNEYPRLLLEFTAAVHTLAQPLPILLQDFANQQLRRHARSARKLAHSHDELTPADRHKMRIAFKKLRYTLEFFSPPVSQKQLPPPYLASINQLQHELGQINDHITAGDLLATVTHNSHSTTLPAWISGRHLLLINKLEDSLRRWLKQRLPT